MLPFLDAIMNGAGKVLDKFIPDAAQREQMKVELEKVAQGAAAMVYQDLANARAREMAVKDKVPAILAISTSAGFFGTLWYMMTYVLPPGSERVIDVMLGSLGAAWLMSFTYYFGSSMGSDAKNKLIDKITSARE